MKRARPVRVKELIELANLLEGKSRKYKIPENGKFHLANWYRQNECGTTACAIGWAVTLLPSWQKLFYLRKTQSVFRPEVCGSLMPQNDTSYHLYDALGMTEKEFENLFFVPEEYHNLDPAKRPKKEKAHWHDPVACAKRIRAFVKKHEAA